MQEIRNYLRRKLQAEVKNGDEFDEFKVVAFCQHVNAVWGEKNNGGRVEPVFTDAEKFVKDILRCGDAAGGSRSVGELASAAGGQESAAAVAEEAVQDLIREGKEAVMAEMEAVARRHLHRRCSSRHRHGQLQMEQKETAAAVARDT